MTTSPEALQRSIAALEYVYDHSKDPVQRKRVAQAILRLKGASSIVPQQLLVNGFTLNQVSNMVHDGTVTEAEANLFFKEWVVGKLEHRWNAVTNKPEECLTNPQTGAETWREMKWG